MPRLAPYGDIRGYIAIPVELLSGTSARDFMTALPLGFKGVIEKVSYVVKIAHTGSSASQTINLLKNSSTVASLAVLVANSGTSGAILDMPITTANQEFVDADTLTLTMAASGTAFTAGSAVVLVRYRTKAQRKAL